VKNPFIVYILSFGGVIILYQLGWSEIYPAISLDTITFFALSFVLAAALALALSSDVSSIESYNPMLPGFTIIIPLACFVADIVYTGYVPLFKMLLGGSFIYTHFVGVPSLHVFAVTFGSAFATIRFADFLYEQDRMRRLRYLAEAMAPIIYCLLVVYRGIALITLTSWFFVFAIKRRRIGLRAIVVTMALGLGVLMLNGLIGEARTGSLQNLGFPSREFDESGVPGSYFAAYLYATGPLANFQHAVATTEPAYDISRTPQFVISEMVPDFISNRLLPLIEAARPAIPEMSRGFNVSSMFGRSYLFFGWIGVLLMFGWLMALAVGYLALILRSPYGVPCLALLNTLVVFSVFDNMIAVSAVSLQLVWPLLLGLLSLNKSSSSTEPAHVQSV
jgi:oligosaccharide repeat unit polymerase